MTLKKYDMIKLPDRAVARGTNFELEENEMKKLLALLLALAMVLSMAACGAPAAP